MDGANHNWCSGAGQLIKGDKAEKYADSPEGLRNWAVGYCGMWGWGTSLKGGHGWNYLNWEAGTQISCPIPHSNPFLHFTPPQERNPGEGKGYPLQYSGLENSMDCIVIGVANNRKRLSDFCFTSLQKRKTKTLSLKTQLVSLQIWKLQERWNLTNGVWD